jgi:hypothetical protein
MTRSPSMFVSSPKLTPMYAEPFGFEQRADDRVDVDEHVVVPLETAAVATVGLGDERRHQAGEVLGAVARPFHHHGQQAEDAGRAGVGVEAGRLVVDAASTAP